ncbi:hypothetical protein RFI_39666, partial [Reticulomyxa filosa]
YTKQFVLLVKLFCHILLLQIKKNCFFTSVRFNAKKKKANNNNTTCYNKRTKKHKKTKKGMSLLRGQMSSLMLAEDREALRLQRKQLQIAGNELNIIDKVENQNMEMDIVFCNTVLDIFANDDNTHVMSFNATFLDLNFKKIIFNQKNFQFFFIKTFTFLKL